MIARFLVNLVLAVIVLSVIAWLAEHAPVLVLLVVGMVLVGETGRRCGR